MSPNTRRSHAKGTAENAEGIENQILPLQTSTLANTKKRSKVAARRVVPESQSHNMPSALGKRTYVPTQTPINSQGTISESPAEQAKTTKKARSVGPARGRPMPLLLPSGIDVESGEFTSNNGVVAIQQRKAGSVVKGKRVELERTSSFYPGRGDNTHALAHIDNAIHPFHAPAVDDDNVDTDDSVEDEEAVELASSFPNKFSESVAKERALWVSSCSSDHKISGRESLNDPFGPNGTGTISTPRLLVQPGRSPTVPTEELLVVATRPNTPDLEIPHAGWPLDTELVYNMGSTKLSLLNQRPIVRAVIQESIEHLRAALLFANAFPDLCTTLTLIKDCLLNAALYLKPGAAEVLDRLTRDQVYLVKITPLPRARISLIRSEIKERCNAITMSTFLMFGSALDTIEYVRKQLSLYTYTFPRATSVNAPNALVMRSKPYRNDRIIMVIRDMFFTGGATSFAQRFKYLFPTYEISHGEKACEVPVTMVALVATALYAALYEWRGGDHQIAEFSANGYLDVYQGHINTLNHIREKREGAFHLMMVDIYKQADSVPIGNEPSAAVPIAPIDLDDLDG